jgi:hypothetical protein
MERLASGTAPLLDTHSAYSLANQIGVVDMAALVGKRGEATVRFSKRDEVEPFYQDVLDKIIRNNSLGYRVYRFEDTGEAKRGYPVLLATEWEPYEISMVPMGADVGARTRSHKQIDTNPCVIVRSGMTDADRARNFRLAMARAF